MSFSKQVENFAKKANDAAERTSRGIIIELFSSVISDTPVKEGRAQGNWQTSVGQPKTNEIERFHKEESINEVISVLGNSKLPPTTYMTNNLPYIVPLEEGSSDQAPAGMMKKNVARIEQLIKKQIRKNKV